MADTRLQILIELQAEAAENALRELEDRLAALGQTGERTSQSTQKVSQRLLEVSKRVAQAKVTVVQAGQAMRQMGEQAQQAGTATRNFGTALKTAVTTGLNRVKQAITTGVARLKKYIAAQIQARRAAKDTGKAAKDASGGVATLNSTLRRLFVFIGGFLVIRRAVGIMAEFGQAMSTVRAISATTAEEFEALEARAKELGATTRFSATEAAEGMVELRRAGLSASEVIETIDDTLILAQAGAIDLADASKLVAVTMAGFRDSGLDANRAVDVLSKAANSATTDVTQLGEALKYSAATAAGFGLDLEQTTAALQILADNALQGSVGGTALRRTLAGLGSAAAKLGIPLEEVDVKAVGLAGAIDRLRGGIPDVNKAIELFGQRAGPAFEILAKNTQNLRDAEKNLRGVEGSARRTAEIMDQNLNGALLAVKSALEALVLGLFDSKAAGSDLTAIVQFLAEAIRGAAGDAEGFSNKVAGFLRGAAYAVAAFIDGWRGLKILWETLQIIWLGFSENVNKGLRFLTAGWEAFKVGVLGVNKVIDSVRIFFVKVVNAIRTKLSQLIQGVRHTIESVDGLADVAIPDKLISSLAKAELALVKGQRESLEYAKNIKNATQAQIDAGNQRVAQLLTEKSLTEQGLEAQRIAAYERLENLANEQSAVDKLKLKFEELEQRRREAAFEEAGRTPEEQEAAAGGAAPTATPVERTTAKDQLKGLQERQKAQELLDELAVASATNVQARLAEADQVAQNEAVRRYEERLAKIALLREQELISESEAADAKTQALAAKENELADLQIAARQRVFDATAQTLANAESAFGDLYEATGKKAKGFFYAQKAISIALTLMKTYEAAQAAYSSAAAIPTVGPYLAPVMAALAVAQGLARVAMIRQQSLAAGGEVLGHSPTSTADNIPINATAGEFVQPVSAVRYYGTGLMEAIRTKSIPRSLLTGYAAPPPPPSHRFAFQAGGAVGASDRATARVAESEQQPIIINNVRDPNEAEQLIQSQPGQRSVWNVIASDPYRLNRILQQGR